VVLAVIAAAIGAYFVWLRGWPAVWLVAIGALLLWAYDAAPRALKELGLGEVAAFVVWGPLMVAGGYFVLSGHVSAAALLASVPYGLGVMSILVGKHIDQRQFDAGKHQRTLPVVLGEGRARTLNRAAVIGMYVVIVGGVVVGAITPFALLVLFAAPLIAAELGFYLDGVPVLGWFFETGRLTTQPGRPGLQHAVHHGQHHGWQATMLTLTALALSRLPRPRLLDAYLALMLAYGVGNLVNDDWLEQVVKRGWTNHEMPSVLVPAANWGWAAVLCSAFVVWRLWFRQPRRTTPAPESPAISSSA
jgi:hypothetical protein